MKQQLRLFVLCLVLALVSLIAIGGFAHSVSVQIEKDARSLAGADVIVESRQPFSKDMVAAVDEFNNQGAQVVQTYQFSSIIRSDNSSLLAWIHAASDGFPLYGTYGLASGTPFALQPSTVYVDPTVLERIGVSVGDSLSIGNASFTIADVVVEEPGIDIDFFSTSKVFMHAADMEQTGLIGTRSRVFRELLIATPQPDQVIQELEQIKGERERVETPSSEAGSIQRFIRNTLAFLQVIALFTMLLGGIGMTTTLYAYIRTQKLSMAIMKALGMRQWSLLGRYMKKIVVLALIAIAGSIAIGYSLQLLLPVLFSSVVPDIDQVFSVTVLAEAALIGLGLTLAFTLLPFVAIRAVRPVEIIRQQKTTRPSWYYWIIIVLIVIGLILLELGRVATSLYFALGFIVLLIVVAAMSYGVLWLTKKIRSSYLWVRQAINGLFRPGNASVLIVASVALSLTVIFSIALIQHNLNEQFFAGFPPDSPTVFFVDIQKDQVEGFQELFEQELSFFPIVRGGLLKINGKSIDFEAREEQGGEPISRQFSLSYGESLFPDEQFVEGNQLFGDGDGDQLSIMDTMAERLEVGVGDSLTFLIQGIEVSATISSIRTRTANDIQPYFYFVFEPETLEKAPQSIFTLAYLEPSEIAQAQNKVAQAFPSVTTIDITQFATKAGEIIDKLSLVVQFFSVLSILAGLLILVSSIFATSSERLKEAVYYKILGGTRSFVRRVFFAEYLYLALVAIGVATLLGNVLAYSVFEFVLELEYAVSFVTVLPLSVAVLVLFPLVGMIVSLPLLRKKPVEYLREHSQE